MRPEFEGTLIVDRLAPNERGVKSITAKQHVAIVNVIAAPMLNQYGFMARITEVFSRHEVVIDMIATSEVSVSMTTDQRVDLDPVVRDLSQFSEVKVDRDRSIVSIVGEGLREDKGFAAKVFDIVRDAEVPVDMISYGATKMNLSFLTGMDRSAAVVKALHRAFFS
jgi:aspartate kinase